MRKKQVPSLGWEDPLKEGTWQPTPVFLPGESPWTEEPGGLDSTGLQRVGHDWATKHTSGPPGAVPSFKSWHPFRICMHLCLQHWVPSDRCAFCFSVFCTEFGVVLFMRVNPIWTYFITEGCTLNHYNSIKIQIPFNSVWLPDLAPIYLPCHISFHLPFCQKLTKYTGNI